MTLSKPQPLRADGLSVEVQKCRDKKVYGSRKLARRAAKKYKGLGKAGARHSYRCPHCGGFHLTHNSNGSQWNNKLAPRSHGPNGGET